MQGEEPAPEAALKMVEEVTGWQGTQVGPRDRKSQERIVCLLVCFQDSFPASSRHVLPTPWFQPQEAHVKLLDSITVR